MPIELWLAYVAMCFLFAVTPGPAVLLTAGQAIARGFSAGFAVVLGTQLGNLVYFVLSAAGLGAILIASETAFTVVKYAGAAYLDLPGHPHDPPCAQGRGAGARRRCRSGAIRSCRGC